jgi:hypothetical protein
MIRKQLYIEPRQDAALKQRARRRGVTEAEIIREALDRDAQSDRPVFQPDPRAWDELTSLRRRVWRRKSIAREQRRWTRDELYEDRVDRQVRRAD